MSWWHGLNGSADLKTLYGLGTSGVDPLDDMDI